MDDDDSIESFDNLFEPFGLKGGPGEKGDPEPRRTQPRQTRQVNPQTTVACVSCGSANDPENRHCERCGARLARTQMPVAPQPMLRTTAGARALIVLATVLPGVALLALLVN